MQKLEIVKLELVGFGKFREKEILLESGLNLIEGGNEAGKSTIQAFLTGMFYGFYQPGAKRRSYTAHQEKYRPWDGGSYRGVMVCQFNDRTVRIERCFDRENESVRVYDDVTGDDITAEFPYNNVTRQVQVGETLLGLSKTAFNNTANIAQLSSSSISREENFSTEVNDKLFSMMKTADSNLSLSLVLHHLDNRLDEIGTPKKSKTPLGQAVAHAKSLLDELNEAQSDEDESFALYQQMQELGKELDALKKEKTLLDAQIRESAAKELGGRYLKAQNLRTRIDRIEKENQKYALYKDVEMEVIDGAQKRLGAKAQITRTLDKYQRALEEVEHRILELNNLHGRLKVANADDTTLAQFDLMLERNRMLEQLRGELQELQSKRSNVSFHLNKLSTMDTKTLENDIQELRRLEQLKSQKKPDHSKPIGIVLLVLGLLFTIVGLTAVLFDFNTQTLNNDAVALLGMIGAAAGIVVAGAGLLFLWHFQKESRKGETLEQLWTLQDEILARYHLSWEEEPFSRLDELLNRVQVNNYKIQQFKEQENLLYQEILAKSQQINILESEVSAYLQRLTANTEQRGDESYSSNEIYLKSLCESVNQAKRIRTDLQRMHLQQQQIQQEIENCSNQIEQINEAITLAIRSCQSAGAQTVDDLEKCRQGKRRYDEISIELKLQKELLAETLGSYTFEELEQNVRSQKSSETASADDSTEALAEAAEKSISTDRKEIHEQVSELNEKIAELSKTAAELDGVRKGKEESHRPVGQIQTEIDEVRALCEKYQTDIDALHLAKDKLLSLSGQLHRDFAPQLNRRVSRAIEQVTNSRYNRIVIDQSLGVRLEDKQSGRLVDISSLSNGMADLIYLVMRLELLDLLCSQSGGEHNASAEKLKIPILLDDSFTQLDDERTARLLRYLLDIPDVQILLFSCHRREKEMLTKAQIPYHLISLKP